MWNDFIFRWISIPTSGSRIPISEMITDWHVDQLFFFQEAVLSILVQIRIEVGGQTASCFHLFPHTKLIHVCMSFGLFSAHENY